MPADAMLIGIEHHSMHAALLGSKPSKLDQTGIYCQYTGQYPHYFPSSIPISSG